MQNEKTFIELLKFGCPGSSVIIRGLSQVVGVPADSLKICDLSRAVLRGFRAWLLSESSAICRNSAAQYTAQLRRLLNDLKADGLAPGLPPDFADLLNIRQLRSRGIYIDNDRLHELEQLALPSTRRDLLHSMEVARLLALISARTGARASDVMRFTPTNIRGNLLTYVPKKTKESSGKVCVVPVGPKTIGWISQVTEMTKGIDLSTEKAEKAFYVRYERALRALIDLTPWDEEVIVFKQNEEQVKRFKDCVTSHTLRHSFATNMYLDDEVGGDIYAIAQMLGHSSADMTMSYICVPFNEKKMSKVKYFE